MLAKGPSVIATVANIFNVCGTSTCRRKGRSAHRDGAERGRVEGDCQLCRAAIEAGKQSARDGDGSCTSPESRGNVVSV